MNMMHTQITRTIHAGISDSVIPEMHNIVENLFFGQKDTEAGTSFDDQCHGDKLIGLNAKLAKNDSRSAIDLKEPTDLSPYGKIFIILIIMYVSCMLQIMLMSHVLLVPKRSMGLVY